MLACATVVTDVPFSPAKAWLSPRARKLLGAATLVLGVWFVSRSLGPVAPRDVDVHVRLSPFRYDGSRAHAMTVSFERDGQPMRAVTERFAPSGPPIVWSRTLSIPEGDYSTTVSLELDGRTAQRTTVVHVVPGAVVEIPAPASE